jgi:hypothetical protein
MTKRHDEKKALDNKCECPKCLEKPTEPTKSEIDTILESEMKVNQVPTPAQMTPQEVIDQNTKKDVEFNDTIEPRTVLDDQFEASPEYVLPKDNNGNPL